MEGTDRARSGGTHYLVGSDWLAALGAVACMLFLGLLTATGVFAGSAVGYSAMVTPFIMVAIGLVLVTRGYCRGVAASEVKTGRVRKLFRITIPIFCVALFALSSVGIWSEIHPVIDQVSRL